MNLHERKCHDMCVTVLLHENLNPEGSGKQPGWNLSSKMCQSNIEPTVKIIIPLLLWKRFITLGEFELFF